VNVVFQEFFVGGDGDAGGEFFVADLPGARVLAVSYSTSGFWHSVLTVEEVLESHGGFVDLLTQERTRDALSRMKSVE